MWTCGTLLMMYRAPCSHRRCAGLFPIEGAHKTVREVTISTVNSTTPTHCYAEGYHDHSTLQRTRSRDKLLDHFNGLPERPGLPRSKNSTRKPCSARAPASRARLYGCTILMDVIREYYREHKNQPARKLKQLYFSDSTRASARGVCGFEERSGENKSGGKRAGSRSTRHHN